MCLCCCCFYCCNAYTSKCVEISIFCLCSIIFISSLLDIILIKIEHLSTACFVLMMLIVLFSTIITINSTCILINRFRGTINKKSNSISICLVRIGLIISIISFILSLVSESMTQTYFNQIDHPCKDYSSSNIKTTTLPYNNKVIRILSDIITEKQKNEYCKDKSKNYNAKICSELEYTISYVTSTIMEFCTLILCFFWFNELKRLKRKVDGALVNNNNNIIINRNINAQQIYYNGEQFNPYSINRNFNQSLSFQSQVILVNNNKKHRYSQPINLNLNFVRDSGRKNFLRNLRQEIKKGINEEDESESKEIDKNSNINNNELNNNKNNNNNLNNNNNINIINNNINNNNNNENINSNNKKEIKKKKNSIFNAQNNIQNNINEKRNKKRRKTRASLKVYDIYNFNKNNEIDNNKKEDIKTNKDDNKENPIEQPPNIIIPNK